MCQNRWLHKSLINLRYVLILIALSASLSSIASYALGDPPFICAVGEKVTFSIPNPPPTAISAAIHVNGGLPAVPYSSSTDSETLATHFNTRIPFNPAESICQWIPAQLGDYRVSIVYEMQGGGEQTARTVYFDGVDSKSDDCYTDHYTAIARLRFVPDRYRSGSSICILRSDLTP